MTQDAGKGTARRDDTRPSVVPSTSKPHKLKEPANYCGICQLSFGSPQALKDHKDREH